MKLTYPQYFPHDTAASDKASREAATVNTEPSKTLQGPAHDADINTIAKAYGLTNPANMPLPEQLHDPRYYGDMTELPETLGEAMELVAEASQRFQNLPADIRSRFNHNPAFLWDFLQDSRNHAEAVQLGLLVDPNPAPPAPPSSTEDK